MKKRVDLDAIVFDIGNVLLRYDPYACLIKKFPQQAARINEAVFMSPHWAEIDRSVLTDEEIFARMIKDAPDMAEWIGPAIEVYPDMIHPMQETIDLLPALKEAGYKLYVLSNYGAEYFARTRVRFPFFDLFDGLLISGEHRVLKPDAAIYLLLLHRFGLEPSRTLFLDDKQENIDGAAAVGMRGLRFERIEQLTALLEG